MFGITPSCDICKFNSNNNAYLDSKKPYCTTKLSRLMREKKLKQDKNLAIPDDLISLDISDCNSFSPEEEKIPSFVYINGFDDLYQFWLSVFNGDYKRSDGFSKSNFSEYDDRLYTAVENCFESNLDELMDDEGELILEKVKDAVREYLVAICPSFPAIGFVMHETSFYRTDSEIFIFNVQPVETMVNFKGGEL